MMTLISKNIAVWYWTW